MTEVWSFDVSRVPSDFMNSLNVTRDDVVFMSFPCDQIRTICAWGKLRRQSTSVNSWSELSDRAQRFSLFKENLFQTGEALSWATITIGFIRQVLVVAIITETNFGYGPHARRHIVQVTISKRHSDDQLEHLEGNPDEHGSDHHGQYKRHDQVPDEKTAL